MSLLQGARDPGRKEQVFVRNAGAIGEGIAQKENAVGRGGGGYGLDERTAYLELRSPDEKSLDPVASLLLDQPFIPGSVVGKAEGDLERDQCDDEGKEENRDAK